MTIVDDEPDAAEEQRMNLGSGIGSGALGLRVKMGDSDFRSQGLGLKD